MSCTITVDGPCRRTLSFTLDRAPIEQELDARVQEIARTQRFKGFRPGKVPLALVRRTHGPALADEIRRRIMGRAIAEAIQEHGLRPVGSPEMNLDRLQDGGEGPFTFELSLEVAPPVEVKLGSTIPVTVALPAVDDAMVEKEVQRLLSQASRLEDAEEGTLIGPKDVLEGSLVYVIDGVEQAPRQARVHLEHELVDAIRIEGAAAACAAHMVGDTVELSATLPPWHQPQAQAGKPATLRFTIERHRLVIRAELDAELLGKLGVASEAELRGHIRAGLESQRRAARDQLVDQQIERHLLATHDFPLPERLVARKIDHRVHEHAHRLIEREGLSSEEGHRVAEDKRAEITASTQDGLRLAFLLAQVALDQGLLASEEEAEEQVRALARQQQGDPEEAVAASHAEGWLADVQEQLTHQNARRWLRQHAEVTETEEAPPPTAGGTATTGAGGPAPEGP